MQSHVLLRIYAVLLYAKHSGAKLFLDFLQFAAKPHGEHNKRNQAIPPKETAKYDKMHGKDPRKISRIFLEFGGRGT